MEPAMFALAALIALQAAVPVPPEPPLTEAYAAQVVGLYSSAAQHRADPRYDEVEARIIRIWPERTDGVWLYQEQAIVNQDGLTREAARAKPYFQFVARIVPLGHGLLRRDNFRVSDRAKWAGVTAGDARLAALTPADLEAPSCHNRLELVSPGYWIGKTESCTNSYRGATMMDSRSISTPTGFVNWDRGLTATGEHVWGPRWGGYMFDRVTAPR
jgi:hypothetical protein